MNEVREMVAKIEVECGEEKSLLGLRRAYFRGRRNRKGEEGCVCVCVCV